MNRFIFMLLGTLCFNGFATQADPLRDALRNAGYMEDLEMFQERTYRGFNRETPLGNSRVTIASRLSDYSRLDSRLQALYGSVGYENNFKEFTILLTKPTVNELRNLSSRADVSPNMIVINAFLNQNDRVNGMLATPWGEHLRKLRGSDLEGFDDALKRLLSPSSSVDRQFGAVGDLGYDSFSSPKGQGALLLETIRAEGFGSPSPIHAVSANRKAGYANIWRRLYKGSPRTENLLRNAQDNFARRRNLSAKIIGNNPRAISEAIRFLKMR